MFAILRRLGIHAGAVLLFVSATDVAHSRQFQTELEAQRHCPQDTVVWVNTKTGVYHFRGQRWYANTTEGAFECRAEANAEGSRATRNGQ